MADGRQWALGVWAGLLAVYACGNGRPGPALGAAGRDQPGQGGEISSNRGGAGGGAPVAGTGGAIAGTGNSSSDVGGLNLQGLAGDQGVAGAASCDLGEVSSTGTNQNLDLFGNVVYFADGIELPAGRYRISYVDGCMKYSAAQDWALHAYAGADPDGWWFVGNDPTQKIVVPPGTVGFLLSNGGFATFEDCVAANLALPPSEFDFAGGKLGAWLQDAPYSDNLAGVDDRNPKWKLTLLGDCDQVMWPK